MCNLEGDVVRKKRDKMSQSLPNEMCNYFIRDKDRA